MVESGTRVERLVSIDIAEKFEALQDEVDLLKAEIKQTLVALRDFLAKQQTVFPQTYSGTRRSENGGAAATKPASAEDPTGGEGVPMPTYVGRAGPPYQGRTPGSEALDARMLENLIGWLGTVKANGLSLHLITPYLEAYEASGYLTPIVAKVILRAMADLDQLVGTSSEQESSPQDYSDCIRYLHQIVCTPGYEPEPQAMLAGRYPLYPTGEETPAQENADSTGDSSESTYPPEDGA